MRGARREHPPKWGCDRRATKQMARRRPAPPGWGSLACWLRCSLLTDRCGYARRSRLASKPNSLQQNRNLFLNEPLVRGLAFRVIPTHPVAPILIVEKSRQLTPVSGVVCLKLVVNVGDQFRLFRRRETGHFTFQLCQTH